ncbi:MAG: cyd operon YbgE family protein [Thauera sp.]
MKPPTSILGPAERAGAELAVADPIVVDRSAAAPAAVATDGEAQRTRVLPLLLAIAVMLGTTAWPGALAGPSGAADHPAAMALFWAMSAGFVAGVGFRPRKLLIRLLFSPLACWLGVILAGLRMGSLMA